MEDGGYSLFIALFVLSVPSIVMLAACFCCRKKVPNGELLGLEGMVIIKNPDENLLNWNHLVSSDPCPNEAEPKRVSNAPHRSLPDIPVPDPNQADTNSDLYATVADKIGDKSDNRSPTESIKNRASTSQHSSISQTNDSNSPYARVRSTSHAYDKVRSTEHPYAQLKNADSSTSNTSPSTSGAADSSQDMSSSRNSSHQNLLEVVDRQTQRQVIPAASAVAGRISASQELPYMTPPITQSQQYFSGDSQDSSKGYTSISVREPLANILAQTKTQNVQTRERQLTDSHYATVSDDSDEMYAAIEDPINSVDLYTSGSDTYAQIQPHQPVQVSVEINALHFETHTTVDGAIPPINQSRSNHTVTVTQSATAGNSVTSIVPSPRQSMISTYAEDSLPTAQGNVRKTSHSRQASFSSCTNSIGAVGSPKPEKRQANSPLPPTPKNGNEYLNFMNASNSNSINSGRNSAASVVEIHFGHDGKRNSTLSDTNVPDDDTGKNRGSKDLEGMYAKVMKKGKTLSAKNVPQNLSPLPHRKATVDSHQRNQQNSFSSDPSIERGNSTQQNATKSFQNDTENNYETIDKHSKVDRQGAGFKSKDPGYETIPGDDLKNSHPNAVNNDCGSYIEPDYERVPDQSLTNNDPDYETVQQPLAKNTSNSDYDPNYEVLTPRHVNAEDGNDIIQRDVTLWRKSDTQTGNGNRSIDEIDGGYLGNSKRNQHETFSLAEVDNCELQSDSDPKYESLRYMNDEGNENPYEQIKESHLRSDNTRLESRLIRENDNVSS